jgi:hypothetical protein
MSLVSRETRIISEVADLIVRLPRENSSWGYDRVAGALTVNCHIKCDWHGFVPN